MTRTGIAAAAVLAFVAGPAGAQEKTVKIGFISTFSGPPAAIGNDMRHSFELGLDHLGRKLGGLPHRLPDVRARSGQRQQDRNALAGRTPWSPAQRNRSRAIAARSISAGAASQC